MLLSDMDGFIEKAKDLRQYDKKDAFGLRYNYKMTDMAAALGLTALLIKRATIEMALLLILQAIIILVVITILEREGNKRIP